MSDPLLLSHVMTWIPVEDRLPDPSQTVMCYDGAMVLPGNCSDGDWITYEWNGETDYREITHWTPFPKPPIPLSSLKPIAEKD